MTLGKTCKSAVEQWPFMAVHAVHRRRLRPLNLNGLRESRAQLMLCTPDAQQNSPTVDPEHFTQPT
jgi:hypothetical protein